jgi:hypothetical protein
MTDPEREHLLGRIADLEGRLRRWRLTSLVLLGLLLLPVVLGGLLGVAWVPRLERERALLEAEQDRAVRAEMEAVSERDRALAAEMQVKSAEEAAARLKDEVEQKHPQGPAEGKESKHEEGGDGDQSQRRRR